MSDNISCQLKYHSLFTNTDMLTQFQILEKIHSNYTWILDRT